MTNKEHDEKIWAVMEESFANIKNNGQWFPEHKKTISDLDALEMIWVAQDLADRILKLTGMIDELEWKANN